MTLTVADIVRKLVGPIKPIGEHCIDTGRLENLKHLESVIEDLLNDITEVTDDRHRVEASMKAIGEHATKFLDDLI